MLIIQQYTIKNQLNVYLDAIFFFKQMVNYVLYQNYKLVLTSLEFTKNFAIINNTSKLINKNY